MKKSNKIIAGALAAVIVIGGLAFAGLGDSGMFQGSMRFGKFTSIKTPSKSALTTNSKSITNGGTTANLDKITNGGTTANLDKLVQDSKKVVEIQHIGNTIDKIDLDALTPGRIKMISTIDFQEGKVKVTPTKTSPLADNREGVETFPDGTEISIMRSSQEVDKNATETLFILFPPTDPQACTGNSEDDIYGNSDTYTNIFDDEDYRVSMIFESNEDRLTVVFLGTHYTKEGRFIADVLLNDEPTELDIDGDIWVNGESELTTFHIQAEKIYRQCQGIQNLVLNVASYSVLVAPTLPTLDR